MIDLSRQRSIGPYCGICIAEPSLVTLSSFGYKLNLQVTCSQTAMHNLQANCEKSRKGGRYTKTPLSLKISLLRAVFQLGEPIKKVSETLKIKYSTAKTLARQYKINNESIDWQDYPQELPPHNYKVTALNRCHYVEVELSELKNDFRESQTDPINGQSPLGQRFMLQHNHIQKGLPSRRIEIISRTVDDSLSLKSGGVGK